MKEHRERRREPRIPSRNLVNVLERDDRGRLATLVTGRTLDMSHGGVRLELDEGFGKSAHLDLRMALGDRLVDASGEVRYVIEHDGRFWLGIRYSDVSEDAYEAIHEHLIRRAA